MIHALLPPLFRHPGFALFWVGVAFSQIGTRATIVANLWQLQELTSSTVAVGLVSLFEAIAVIGLAPIGGTVADRMNRKRLLQIAQGAALLASIALTALTLTHTIAPLWIYAAATVVAGAAVFDTPARQSLVPALVPREQIVDAYALLIPAGNVALLVGPAIAGILIALWGAGAVYIFDVITYLALILSLSLITFARMEARIPQAFWSSVIEGFRYVRGRPLIWQLMALDLAAVLFGSYRVLLPVLARDLFQVGPAGYGLLSAAPAVGAILGAGAVYRVRAWKRKGLMVLAATMLYAVCASALGFASAFALAVIIVGGLGFFDSVAQVIRNALIQLDTPDRLRGRVTALYQMTARGGPALGQAQLGSLAALLGAPLALTAGSAITLVCAIWIAVEGKTIREHES
jgi:MFS family permease